MKLKSKKMWFAAATSLVSVTSLLSAADDAQVRNLENRVSALEQRKGANGMINPPARPEAKDGSGLYITGDLLYWEAHENGLDYVIQNNNTTSAGTILGGKVEHPDFDWDFGFRVGIGYAMPHDGWDLYLNWTHLHTDGHDSTFADTASNQGLYPIYLNGNTLTGNLYAATASEHWKLRLNTLDLELGREFFVSKWLTLRPFMGLRTAWVHQKANQEYTGGTLVSSGLELKERNKNNYWGLGIRGGLDTDWGLGGGWSIFGNAALSLLYGHFSIDQSEKLQSGSALVSQTLGIQNHYHLSRAISDLALGLRWQDSFADDSFFLSIQAGWEHHMFFGQNQLMRFVSSEVPGAIVSNQGDLTLQGWTLNATLAF